MERQAEDPVRFAKRRGLTHPPRCSLRSGLPALVLAVLWLVAVPAPAQTARFTVLLSVPKQNEYTELTRSFIARELRELKDVAVVDRAGQFVISVVPVPVQVSRGSAPATTVALVVSFFIEDGDWIVHDVVIGAPQDLRSLCEKIVARFDVGILQPKRDGNRS